MQPLFKEGRKTVPFRPGKDNDNTARMRRAGELWVNDATRHGISRDEVKVVDKLWRKGLVHISVDRIAWKKTANGEG